MSHFIVGAGIVTENVPNFQCLLDKNIDQFDLIEPKENIDEYLDLKWLFQSKLLVAREDKSLLNKISQLAIDASKQSMDMAETSTGFTEQEKIDFSIYTATETIDYELSCLDKLLFDNSMNVEKALEKLGDLKGHLNPLDMLRLLSTNPLYHLSKFFGLQGGGYPIRRMSLSSLCALETATNFMSLNKSNTLISSVGNLGTAENITAFSKLGLLRSANSESGIIPAFGAASVVLEHGEKNSNRKFLAEIITVHSTYHSESFINASDWLNLYDQTKFSELPTHVIYYNNGVKSLFDEEEKAVAEFFPDAKCYSYKPYIGYTGKSNNLIDLTIAIADKRIPANSHVLINGVGTAVGIGCILIRKF
jgi:hypothetical protein